MISSREEASVTVWGSRKTLMEIENGLSSAILDAEILKVFDIQVNKYIHKYSLWF